MYIPRGLGRYGGQVYVLFGMGTVCRCVLLGMGTVRVRYVGTVRGCGPWVRSENVELFPKCGANSRTFWNSE